ncbi:MAG: carboxymuconolactone decarboxylase family protein [Acidobacteria bacterium]|nr:carboxymuconolactone decarboxylase family protein [Acidobacteriota bacterium]
MTLFPTHTLQSAPEGSREVLNAARERFGMIPNLLGILAESPTALKVYFTVANLFSESSLSPVEQQVVLLAVSFENRCEYCVAAHSMLARHVGAGDDVVDALREGKEIHNPRLEALRQFTRSVVQQRGWVAGPEVHRFVDAGFTRAQVFEVLVGVAQKTISNYANHLAGTPVDQAFQAHAWTHPDSRTVETVVP